MPVKVSFTVKKSNKPAAQAGAETLLDANTEIGRIQPSAKFC